MIFGIIHITTRMSAKEVNHFKPMFKLVWIVVVCQFSFAWTLRTPDYATGKYTATDVDAGTWNTTKTLSNVNIDKLSF